MSEAGPADPLRSGRAQSGSFRRGLVAPQYTTCHSEACTVVVMPNRVPISAALTQNGPGLQLSEGARRWLAECDAKSQRSVWNRLQAGRPTTRCFNVPRRLLPEFAAWMGRPDAKGVVVETWFHPSLVEVDASGFGKGGGLKIFSPPAQQFRIVE